MKINDDDCEPEANMGMVCPDCAPKPDAELAKEKVEFFFGKYVKRAFMDVESGKIEHMWVEITGRRDINTLKGTLANDPKYNVGVVDGDEVFVSLTEIEDVYVE